LSLVFSLVLTPLFAKLARRLRIVDRPAHRKTHKEPVSYLGGLAVLLAFILAFALTFYFYRALDDIFSSRGFAKAFLILGSSLGVALIGLWDDIRNIRPRYKLMGQLIFALAFTLFGFRFEILQLPGLPAAHLGLLSIPVTIFWIVAVVNAFNMVDGLDGLASVIIAGSLTLLAGGAALVGSSMELLLALGALGAVLGFLPFNWKPAVIYLGDAGSGGLGMFLACSLVTLGQGYRQLSVVDTNKYFGQPFFYQILIVTLLVAYPALEITLSVARRLLHGRSIASADRGHIHHRLLKAGWQSQGVCLNALVLTFLPGLAALEIISNYHGRASWLLLIFGLILGFGFSTLGFLDFLQPKLVERLRPHYQIARHFISMQKIKLSLAESREDVLTLINQTCQEMGVKGYRLIVLPDGKKRGGLDYTHSFDPTRLSKDDKSHGPMDRVRLPDGQGGAEWVFEPQGVEEELDVEYRVLLSEFMRLSLETAAKLGDNQETLELPSVVAFPQGHVTGHHLRKKHKNERA